MSRGGLLSGGGGGGLIWRGGLKNKELKLDCGFNSGGGLKFY